MPMELGAASPSGNRVNDNDNESVLRKHLLEFVWSTNVPSGPLSPCEKKKIRCNVCGAYYVSYLSKFDPPQTGY
jgi:hypothetical protein